MSGGGLLKRPGSDAGSLANEEEEEKEEEEK